jgi:small subunit ribosomal protein S2
MASIDKLVDSPNFNNISKRERLQITRERAKLEKNLGSIADLGKLPAALLSWISTKNISPFTKQGNSISLPSPSSIPNRS